MLNTIASEVYIVVFLQLLQYCICILDMVSWCSFSSPYLTAGASAWFNMSKEKPIPAPTLPILEEEEDEEEEDEAGPGFAHFICCCFCFCCCCQWWWWVIFWFSLWKKISTCSALFQSLVMKLLRFYNIELRKIVCFDQTFFDDYEQGGWNESRILSDGWYLQQLIFFNRVRSMLKTFAWMVDILVNRGT